MKRQYVWSLEVTYPPDSQRPHTMFPDIIVREPLWAPPGWEPDEEYINRFGTTRFIWPSVKRIYFSRSAAVSRAQMLQRFGAEVHLLRSQPIAWEERPFKRSGPALRVVKGTGA